MRDLKYTEVFFGVVSSLFLINAWCRKERQVVHRSRRTRLPPNCLLDPVNQGRRESVNVEEYHKGSSQCLTMFFEQVGKQLGWLVGGKGANLGELCSSGFPVPDGYCVTKLAFDAHMGQIFEVSGRTLSEVIENSPDMSAAVARTIVENMKVQDEVALSIRDAYRTLCTRTGESNLLVAVRSSATAEDSAEASFAGQLDTFLGVQGEDNVVNAVKACWASLYSDRVDSYRSMIGKGRGTKESTISVCVVVQQMLAADSAGVMFTANPFTQALDETVITGNWGLGESVVADIATPDTWVIKGDEVISESVSIKKKKVILAPFTNGHQTTLTSSPGCSVVVDIVDSKEQTSPCLCPKELHDLTVLGRRVQAHYQNHPQDVEWGLKQGKVYLLQARPITTLSDEPPRTINEFDAPCRPDDWITTCNAAEMFPGPMTPLTMSTFGRMADQGVQRMQMMFGCRDRIDLVNRVTGNYSGNFFLNMTNTLAPMCAGMIGAQMAKDNGEMSILGFLNQGESLQRLVDIGGGPRSIFVRLLNGVRYMKTMVLAKHRIPIMWLRIAECEKEFRNLFESTSPTLSGALIWHTIDSLMDAYDDQWTDGIVTSSTSAAAMLFAMKLLTERGGDIWGTEPVAELAILLGEETSNGTAESAGAVEAVDKLCNIIVSSQETRDSASSFCSSAPEEALVWLRSKQLTNVEFTQLLNRHGHRCVREAEMREKDWSEDPLPLIRMIQSSVRAALARNGKPNNANSKIPVDPEMVIRSKKHLNPITRTLLRSFVRVTRKSVHLRELGKSLQVKLNAVFKHAYRRLGHQLVTEGRLPDPDLLYFLTHEEIGVLACVKSSDMAVHRLKTRATQRKRLFSRQAQLKFPELSCGIPQPVERTNAKRGEVGQEFSGTPVSAGMARGRARVARTLEEAELLKEGEILITPQTDVGWTPYFSIASGLVTEIGGMLSHGAVVAREYSLPCVVGVSNACDLIQTGTLVELDGDCGKLRVVELS